MEGLCGRSRRLLASKRRNHYSLIFLERLGKLNRPRARLSPRDPPHIGGKWLMKIVGLWTNPFAP